MQVEQVEGYFEGDRFIPAERIQIPRNRKVIVTILNEPAVSVQEKEKKAWEKFLADIAASDEELIGEPERVNFHSCYSETQNV
jgi:hypothetical protein